MIIILLTVILKIMGIVLMLQLPLFAIGLMIEIFALISFIKKK
jgi:hypothetical protein